MMKLYSNLSSKCLSEGALQIAEKRRDTEREKERYTHLNVEFQRIARRDKKAFLCRRKDVHRFVDLSLGFLFCSINLYFCLCASTILSGWLWLCSRAWSQAGWFLQFHSSFSRLLWLFEVFYISIQIVKLFVLVLWKIPLVTL